MLLGNAGRGGGEGGYHGDLVSDVARNPSERLKECSCSF